ncbi:adenine deaminase/adenosine deaminase [Polyplosphaeria fusca]|uniref:Adenine deaminase n=1 Tax=Polyplosphaeria fusca TaxID=682080 RepID=A0A9P4UUE7_9PLEO|nr:adenine deaminase/adenosine deaminase [Polyplosphaeria fusca]
MCKSPFHAFLKALPKCEHHIHLEGALTPSLLFSLAKRNSISLPTDDPSFASPEALIERYQRFTSLDDFLQYYYIGFSVLLHSSDFEALAWDYFQHASDGGVHHAEVFFDPQAHTSRGVSYTTVLSGFQAACSRAERELGITTELITCYLRHLPVSDALAMFDHAEVQESYRNGSIRGIGMDSSELDFPPELFQELFDKAREQGLRLTTHAGEEGPADYIATALNNLGVERIDHGIHLADDEELMKQVVARGTLLTICPMSNVVLRCVKEVKYVPIRKFLNAGVKFSINSDDPAYFGGYILDNYCAVHDAFDLSIAEWESIARASIEGSWCGDERKQEMLAALAQHVETWERK